MSFFVNGQQKDVLEVTGTYNAGSQRLTAITLPNNTTLTLNLAGLAVTPSNKQLSNPQEVETLKIVIEWGDGETDSIAPFFRVPQSSIFSKFDPWTTISHFYSLTQAITSINLVIRCYNSINDCVTITVPITMQYQSLLESCAKLNLVSGSITNDNTVSYVVNNSTEKSNFVVAAIEK